MAYFLGLRCSFAAVSLGFGLGDGAGCWCWVLVLGTGAACKLVSPLLCSTFSCSLCHCRCRSCSMVQPHPRNLPFRKRQAPERRCFFLSCSTYTECVCRVCAVCAVCVRGCISCVFLLCAYANMQLSWPAIERHVCCHLTWHSVARIGIGIRVTS